MDATKPKHQILALFVLSSLAYLSLVYCKEFDRFKDSLPNETVLAVIKCIPIWLLVALARVMSTPEGTNRYTRLITIGLVFSSFGDFTLAISEYPFLKDIGFLLGLIFFFVAHIFFVFAFGINRSTLHLERLIPLALFGGGTFYYVLLPHLKRDLVVPVAAYIAVLITMVWRAASRIGRENPKEGIRLDLWWGFIGAVVFLTSDLTLAINKFVVPFRGAGLATMITYYTAMFGIAVSVNRDLKVKTTKTT